jgi:CRP/FNR family transcriptional regulator, dissimilatory nitrate respiration regulator
MANIGILIHCPVFFGLEAHEIESLISVVHHQIRHYSKGEIVVMAGEPVRDLIIILSGSVKGEMIDFSGKTIKIEDIEAPKPLASAFLFGKENRFPVTVTANEEVEVLTIPVAEFMKIMQQNTRVLINYLNSISSRAQFLSQKLHFLSFKTIREKIADYLLQNAGDRYHSIELKNTQQQLADMFGVARPSFARVLGEMQAEGLIEVDRKTVKILDKAGLSALLKNS